MRADGITSIPYGWQIGERYLGIVPYRFDTQPSDEKWCLDFYGLYNLCRITYDSPSTPMGPVPEPGVPLVLNHVFFSM